MTLPDWEQVLDYYEASLQGLRAWLADGAAAGAPAGFDPPQGVTPLPAELRERAQRLLGESMLLQAQVTELSHRRARERVQVRRRGRPRPPLFVDRTG